MGRVQKNPYKFLYEPKTFDGIPAIGIGANLDHSLIPKDFFCYDICQSDMENTSGFLLFRNQLRRKPKAASYPRLRLISGEGRNGALRI